MMTKDELKDFTIAMKDLQEKLIAAAMRGELYYLFPSLTPAERTALLSLGYAVSSDRDGCSVYWGD